MARQKPRRSECVRAGLSRREWAFTALFSPVEQWVSIFVRFEETITDDPARQTSVSAKRRQKGHLETVVLLLLGNLYSVWECF